MISRSVLVAKAGRWGWLLLLSGSQMQVRGARPWPAGGPCRLGGAGGIPRASVDLALNASRPGLATQPERDPVLNLRGCPRGDRESSHMPVDPCRSSSEAVAPTHKEGSK
jgi:hypothetical protein